MIYKSLEHRGSVAIDDLMRYTRPAASGESTYPDEIRTFLTSRQRTELHMMFKLIIDLSRTSAESTSAEVRAWHRTYLGSLRTTARLVGLTIYSDPTTADEYMQILVDRFGGRKAHVFWKGLPQ